MASKKKSMGAGPDSGVGGRPNSNSISTDVTGWNGGRFTRAERNQAAFLGAAAHDCQCERCDHYRSIAEAVANPGNQF